VITQAEISTEPEPKDWKQLQPGAPVESLGVYGSHFFYYKIAANPGATVTLQIQKGDGIVASAGGALLTGSSDKTKTQIAFTLPANAKELVALYENLGHPNVGRTLGEPFGILSVQGADETKPLELARGAIFEMELQNGGEVSNVTHAPQSLIVPMGRPVSVGKGAAPAPDALLTSYKMKFELPEKASGISAPWCLHLEANGNGFIYVNGHCIGRYWQAGPQHDFFLPDCWLSFGHGNTNIIALDLRPVDKGVSLQAVSVAPDSTFAVETAAVGQ